MVLVDSDLMSIKNNTITTCSNRAILPLVPTLSMMIIWEKSYRTGEVDKYFSNNETLVRKNRNFVRVMDQDEVFLSAQAYSAFDDSVVPTSSAAVGLQLGVVVTLGEELINQLCHAMTHFSYQV